MPLIMFDDFLENKNSYFLLEQYWIDFFYSILNERNEPVEEWIVPYYNTTFKNGEKFMDGNPIFSAKSYSTNKIIRIIQEIYEGEYTLNYWIEHDKKELVLVVVLCKENISRIKYIINDWIDDVSS
jgi:hypothetical protein